MHSQYKLIHDVPMAQEAKEDERYLQKHPAHVSWCDVQDTRAEHAARVVH